MPTPSAEELIRVVIPRRVSYWAGRGVKAHYPEEWIVETAARVPPQSRIATCDALTRLIEEFEEKFWDEIEREADLGGALYLAE
jgi:hypothetical protein